MASLPFSTTPNSQFFHFKPTNPQNRTQNNLSKLKTNLTSSNSYLETISFLSKQGRIQEAVDLLTEMDLKSILAGPELYGELLQGCVYERALFTGQQIHGRIVKKGEAFARNDFVGTKLLALYAKCDVFEAANQLFAKLRVKNVFAWAAVIGLYCRIGFFEDALTGFCEMVDNGCIVDNFVLPNTLKACGALRWIGFGRSVHGYVVKMGFSGCVFVSSSLVDMYGKCGVLDYAREVFDDTPVKNVVSWNSMISCYLQNGFNEEAIKLFFDMRWENIEPSQVTLSSFLSASANLGAIEEGKQGHAIAIINGFQLDNFFGSSVMNFYSKIGLIEDVESVFSRMRKKDAVTWNLLVSSYVQCQQFEKALDTCRSMLVENIRFDSVTMASILSVCCETKNIELSRASHCYCIRNNLESDVIVSGSILDMYVKCEKIDYARKVFNFATNRTLVLWNTLLTAYAELGLVGEALKLFYQMQLESVPPNAVSWNAVISGFLRNGLVKEAKDMFLQMLVTGLQPKQDTLSTLISGLLQNGLVNEAILVFQKAQESRITPSEDMIVSVISACSAMASLLYGRIIHGYIIRHNLSSSIPISTALVDMYAKCGSIYPETRASVLR